MKKTVLALVAVLGLASCDRDERVLEVVKEVEKTNALLGEWKLVEASVDGEVKTTANDKCIAESVLTFTEDTYTANLSIEKAGKCVKEERTGKYIHGEKLGLINLIPSKAGENAGTYSIELKDDKIVLTLQKEQGKDKILTFQKAK